MMSFCNTRAERIQEHFNTYLKLKGYRVHRMPGDANCLYHAITAGVHNEFNAYRMRSWDDLMSQQLKMRKKLQRHVVLHLQELEKFFPVDASVTPEKRAHFINVQCNRIGKNFQAGGEVSIAAAAVVYQRKIIVEKPLEGPSVYNVDHDGIPVFLSCYNNHYNLLGPDPNPRPNVPRVVQLHFNDYLKLKQYKVEPQISGVANPYNAIAAAVKGSPDEVDAVRLDLKFYLMRNMKEFKQKIFHKIQHNLPKDLSDDYKDQAIEEFVENVSDDPFQGDDFMIDVASQCYKKTFIVERPIDVPLVFKYADNGVDAVKILALHPDGHYDFLQKIDSIDDEDLDDDVVWIDPVGHEISQEDSSELLFIKANLYRNLRTPVTVVFLVPVSGLKHKRLDDAIREVKPAYLRHIVFYNQVDFTKFKGDKEARQLYTMYTHTLNGPFDRKMLSRITWMAHLLLPPLFWTLSRCTWEGISIESTCKFGYQSLPIILLTHAWPTIKDAVRKDVNQLLKPEKLMCNGCNADCELKDIKSHYDTTKFVYTLFEEVSTVKAADRYDIFQTEEDLVPPVVKKIQQLYSSPGRSVVPALLRYLDKPASVVESHKYTTYMVLHVDGPFIHLCNGRDSYFPMINDPANVKSIYVGTTTDAVFRLSHFIQTSSLSEVFSRTSKLFLLRSIKFETQEEAKRDEAIVLEILTTLLESWAHRRIPANFLFLNVNNETMNLLPEATTSHPQIWAEFARREIPVFQVNEDDNEIFSFGSFSGNYKVERELEVVDGKYSLRTFEELEDVYTRIRARQP